MTDYEYILLQAKKFHFTGWNDEELRKCVDMLPNLTRQELITLTLNKLQKTVDIHPPKTGISVHFSDSFILVALQI